MISMSIISPIRLASNRTKFGFTVRLSTFTPDSSDSSSDEPSSLKNLDTHEVSSDEQSSLKNLDTHEFIKTSDQQSSLKILDTHEDINTFYRLRRLFPSYSSSDEQSLDTHEVIKTFDEQDSLENLDTHEVIKTFDEQYSLENLDTHEVSKTSDEQSSLENLDTHEVNNTVSRLRRLFTPFYSDPSDSSYDEQSDLKNLDTHEVIKTFYRLRKTEPNLALSYFTRLREDGFKHNLSTYIAFIRFLCYWGMEIKLASVLSEVIEDDGGLGFDVADLIEAIVVGIKDEGNVTDRLDKAYDGLIKVYVCKGRFDEAAEMLFSMERRGLVLSILASNFLMNRLVQEKKGDMALAVYQQLTRIGLVPNVYTYTIVIKAFCSQGRLEDGLKVFKEMEEAGVAPNAFTYAAYVDGLCSHGSAVLGYEMVQALREAKAPIDVFSYEAVIRGLVKELKFSEAENVLFDMEQGAIAPDVYCYEALIIGYCKKGDIIKALSHHNDMASKGIKINCVILSSFIRCLCMLNMASEAVDLFMSFKGLGKVFLDEVSFNVAIDAFCKLGKLEEGMKLLEEMKGMGMTPNVVHYTTLINGYFHQGNVFDALNLLEEMIDKGLKPDIFTYNVLAGGLSRCGLVEEAIRLLDEMGAQGVEPTTDTHNSIIKGLCIGGKVKEAEFFFCRLEGKELDNYAAMVNGYCEANYTLEAYELFHRFSEQGVLLKRASCKKLLTSLCKEGETERALQLLKALLDLDGDICEKMCRKLISACCRAGDMGGARWVFDTMVGRGLTPDLITYKVNCLQEARDLFEEMKDRGIEPELIPYRAMVDGHLEAEISRSRSSSTAGGDMNNLEYLTHFLGEMQGMELFLNSIFYTTLIDHYRKADYLEDAIQLLKEMVDRGLEPSM